MDKLLVTETALMKRIKRAPAKEGRTFHKRREGSSGYARNAIVHHSRLDPGVELLSKLYSFADLATRARRTLDRG
jgi:hypothetical protein